MSIQATKALLTLWGHWGGRINLGYPTTSSGPWRLISYRTPTWTHENPDPQVLEVDKAVSKVEPEYKRLLSDRYQWQKPRFDICRQYGWSTATYYRRLGEAQWAVHVTLGS